MRVEIGPGLRLLGEQVEDPGRRGQVGTRRLHRQVDAPGEVMGAVDEPRAAGLDDLLDAERVEDGLPAATG
ncbi:hypothetical protein V2I01_38625 [Micromonospora sp. BRA006-A]|nr:hypothetical protein [Micromonospora sp. BRA006-A]